MPSSTASNQPGARVLSSDPQISGQSESNLRSHKWLQTGIYVKVRNYVHGGFLVGLNWRKGSGIVKFENDEEVRTTIREIEPVIPQEGDVVLILNGNERGQQAIVETIDERWQAAKIVTLDGDKLVNIDYRELGIVGFAGCSKPILCSNIEYGTMPSELERLFKQYGEVQRIDLTDGRAYVFMVYMRHAKEAITRLDGRIFRGRKLRVNWAKEARRTLFVTNFDSGRTRINDLERHFSRFGEVLTIIVIRTYAFIQFRLEENALKALEQAHNFTLLARRLVVKFARRESVRKRPREDNSSPRERRQRSRRQRT